MLLEIKNIYFAYKTPILDYVSLYVKRGEIVGLLGPNGAGKTSLFSIIMGGRKSISGEVSLNGKSLVGLPIYERARHGLGYLPQESSIFHGLTVEENILSVLQLHCKSPKARLEELLNQFHLGHLRDTKGRHLSGGERRRVEVARALATRPKFLLLDEPLAAMDPITIQQMKNLVVQLKRMNIGILVTDHNVKDTLDIIDRGYILHEGKIICEGEPDVLVAHRQAQNIYFGLN